MNSTWLPSHEGCHRCCSLFRSTFRRGLWNLLPVWRCFAADEKTTYEIKYLVFTLKMIKHLFSWSQSLPNSILACLRSKLKPKRSACMICSHSVNRFEEWKTGFSQSCLKEVRMRGECYLPCGWNRHVKLCLNYPGCASLKSKLESFIFVSLRKHPE